MEIKRVDTSRNPKWVDNVMNWIIYGNLNQWAENNKQKILTAIKSKNNGNN